MQPQEIQKIIENEFAANQERSSLKTLFAIRKRFVEAILDEMAPGAPVHYRQRFLELEDAARPLNILGMLSKNAQLVQLTMEAIEEVVRLYEQWQRMLAFLIDEYDALPEDLKKEWEKDHFMQIAAYAQQRHTDVFDAFGAMMVAPLCKIDLELIRGNMACVRWAVLGSKEQLGRYIDELFLVWSVATPHIPGGMTTGV